MIYAKCAATGEMKRFCGPNIQAPNQQIAHEYCQTHGLGYCEVGDEVVCEIPCKEGSYEPDFNKMVDYESIQNN